MVTEGPPVCLSCCQELEGEGVGCPQCKLPLCGKPLCWAPESHHSLGECTFLKNSSNCAVTSPSRWATDGVYQAILVLRCLTLRERNPVAFGKLLSLPFCVNSKKLTQLDKAVVFKLVKQWLPSSTVSLDLVIKMCGIFATNSIEAPQPNVFYDNHALYAVSCKIDHRCVPNAFKSFTKSGKIVVTAAVPIPNKGTRIYLNYVESWFLEGTLMRQLQKRTRLENCRCERCKDPSELGTYCSAIYCTKCPNKKGILLPENPLSSSADWFCNNCSDRKPVSFALDLVQRIRLDAEIVSRDLGDTSKSEAFIRKWEKVVHPNYFMMIPIKIYLCKAYDLLLERVPKSDIKGILKKKKILVLELLKVCDVIRPGWNRLRGVLLYHHFLSLGIKSSITEYLLEDASAQQLLPRFKLAQKLLKEVIAISALDASKSEEDCRALSYSSCAAAGTHGGCKGGCHSHCLDSCPHKNECELKEVEFLIDVMEKEI